MPRVIKSKQKIKKEKVVLNSYTADELSEAIKDMCQNGQTNHSKKMKVYMSMNNEGTEIASIGKWSFHVDFDKKYMIIFPEFSQKHHKVQEVVNYGNGIKEIFLVK